MQKCNQFWIPDLETQQPQLTIFHIQSIYGEEKVQILHCKCFRLKLHDVSQRSIPGTISVVLFTTNISILQIVVLLLQYDKIVVLFTTDNSILRIVVLYSSTTKLSYFLLRIVVLKVRLHLLYDKYVVLLLQSSGN